MIEVCVEFSYQYNYKYKFISSIYLLNPYGSHKLIFINSEYDDTRHPDIRFRKYDHRFQFEEARELIKDIQYVLLTFNGSLEFVRNKYEQNNTKCNAN